MVVTISNTGDARNHCIVSSSVNKKFLELQGRQHMHACFTVKPALQAVLLASVETMLLSSLTPLSQCNAVRHDGQTQLFLACVGAQICRTLAAWVECSECISPARLHMNQEAFSDTAANKKLPPPTPRKDENTCAQQPDSVRNVHRKMSGPFKRGHGSGNAHGRVEECVPFGAPDNNDNVRKQTHKNFFGDQQMRKCPHFPLVEICMHSSSFCRCSPKERFLSMSNEVRMPPF